MERFFGQRAERSHEFLQDFFLAPGAAFENCTKRRIVLEK